MDTIDDGAITRFYESKTPNGETWDRKFSLVVAQSPSQTCGAYDANKDVFLSNSLKGEAVDFWAILNRQVRLFSLRSFSSRFLLYRLEEAHVLFLLLQRCMIVMVVRRQRTAI